MQLLEDTKYRAHQTAVCVEEIRRYLQAHPELVGDWHIYSENKRTSSGWYFDAAARRVGYYSGGRREDEQTFADVSEACAAFIKHEMDSIICPAAQPASEPSSGERAVAKCGSS